MVDKYLLLYLFSKLMNLVKSVVQAENLFLSAEVETLEEALRVFGAERERRQHRYHLPDLLRRVEGPRQHRRTALTDRRPEQICKQRLSTVNVQHRHHLPDLLRRVEGPWQHRRTAFSDRRPEQICKTSVNSELLV